MGRLFGFRLNDANSLIMFVFALGLVLIGFYEMYVLYTYFNETGAIPPVHTIFMIICLTLGLYITFQTLRHRGTTIRN